MKKRTVCKKLFAIFLSSMMLFTCIPSKVKAVDDSEQTIIDGLVDIPDVFVDKDSQDLGGNQVYYRKTNTSLSMLPINCYQKADM